MWHRRLGVDWRMTAYHVWRLERPLEAVFRIRKQQLAKFSRAAHNQRGGTVLSITAELIITKNTYQI